MLSCDQSFNVFFFNDTATTEIYTLSLHDALPICRGVLALVEHRLDGLALQPRVQLDAVRTDHAVRRPGLQVVRLLGEVAAGVDVVVAGGHHVRVVGRVRADVLADRGGDVRTAGDGEAAALAEVVLHVHDEQSARHLVLLRPSGCRWRSPRGTARTPPRASPRAPAGGARGRRPAPRAAWPGCRARRPGPAPRPAAGRRPEAGPPRWSPPRRSPSRRRRAGGRRTFGRPPTACPGTAWPPGRPRAPPACRPCPSSVDPKSTRLNSRHAHIS